jgi:hypothetical protein
MLFAWQAWPEGRTLTSKRVASVTRGLLLDDYFIISAMPDGCHEECHDA